MAGKKTNTPLYNYKNPKDYKVFNMGNEASPAFTLKSGNATSFKMMGSSPLKDTKTAPDNGNPMEADKRHKASVKHDASGKHTPLPMKDMSHSEITDRARKSKARTDLLDQLTPEELAKYKALSGKEKFHVSQNTTLDQLRNALGEGETPMAHKITYPRTHQKAGHVWNSENRKHMKDVKHNKKFEHEDEGAAMKYTGATDTMSQNFAMGRKKSKKKSIWDDAPPSGTQARRDFYKKHNLKMDDTTVLKMKGPLKDAGHGIPADEHKHEAGFNSKGEKVDYVKRTEKKKKSGGMDSATRKRYNKAFAAARKAGKKTFTFEGKSYNTKLA